MLIYRSRHTPPPPPILLDSDIAPRDCVAQREGVAQKEGEARASIAPSLGAVHRVHGYIFIEKVQYIDVVLKVSVSRGVTSNVS